MSYVRVTCGEFVFEGRLEVDSAPDTCAWFTRRLPWKTQVIHARWSGEAVWVPLGELESGLINENHTLHPSRGDFLFYPGGVSETELLFVYGSSVFASKVGKLAGNHFMTIVEGSERLAEFGEHVLWNGAQDIEFSHIE